MNTNDNTGRDLKPGNNNNNNIYNDKTEEMWQLEALPRGLLSFCERKEKKVKSYLIKN